MSLTITPEFIRLPEDGEHCPHTGMKRGSLRNLCLPTAANKGKPAVPAKCLRQKGKLRGIWLIPYDALVAHLNGLPTALETDSPTTTTAGVVEAGSAPRKKTSGRLRRKVSA
jgi:hypothetical protein